MGNWKILVPSFVWSLTSPKAKKARKTKKHDGSTTTKMKALMKSLGVREASCYNILHIQLTSLEL